MSKPSSLLRLAGIFKPSLSPPPTTTTTISKKKASEYERIVTKFKKFSESEYFRKNSQRAYLFYVRRLASMKQFSSIDDILQHQKKYPEVAQEQFVNRIMLLYGYAGMFEHAHKLFEEMPQLKCDRTIRSFNTLLSACIHSNRLDEVENLLNQLPDKVGIEPDLVSYNTVIKAYCQMGSLDTALSMIDTLEMKGLEPDVITFGILIDAFFCKGRIDDGEKIWELMERKNLVPDMWCYNSKLKWLVCENKIPEGFELWEYMKTKGFEPDVFSYNAWIDKYCKDGNVEQVNKWYNDMKKVGVSPNRFTYYTLIYFFLEKCEFETVVELCKEAIHRRIITKPIILQTVVNGLIKNSKVDEAVQLVELSSSLSRFRLTLPKSSVGP